MPPRWVELHIRQDMSPECGSVRFCPHIRLRGSFIPSLIAAIKLLPWTERAWHPDAASWYFPLRHLEHLKSLAIAHSDYAELIDGNAVTHLQTGRTVIQEELF